MKVDEREKRAKIMGEGEMKKVLLSLAIPAIIAQLVNVIYNLADTAFVGMLNDTSAMGAVSVAYPLMMLLSAVGLMFGVGAASYIARCLGENRKDGADKATSTAFFSVVAVGIICTIFGHVFLNQILKSLGATQTIMPYAVSYSKILISGSVFIMLNMTLNNMIRAEGNAKFSMFAICLGAGLNIILDPIFMFVFDMGIKGAAVATVTGQIVSTIYLTQYFFRGKSFIKIDAKLFSFSKKIYSEIMKIGIPTFFMQFLTSMSMGLLNTASAAYGDSAVAAVGITLRIVTIGIYVIFGYNQGFMPVVGYNYGAKNYERVSKSIKLSLIWTTAFSTILSIVCITQAEALMKFFTKDTEVISIGINYIIASNILIPFLGFQLVYACLFQALGKSIPAGILSISRQGLFLIPSIVILPSFFERHINSLSFLVNLLPNSIQPGMYGVVYTQFAADIVTIVITSILAVKVNKQLNNNSLENKKSEDMSLKLQLKN
ncbi:MATE family efflux transporter [Tepidibacter aestuarii]|uniref:MATE family efflux transporter n=1 Tax=Tepidibacter aestuarii TaxID=2925782 RepID=UPI0020C06C56|nr:MATE family efflux transporter [Tepidibacter aestuarii]CAH2213902.1 multidrug efflux pump [Tepidibacter aestuarii]